MKFVSFNGSELIPLELKCVAFPHGSREETTIGKALENASVSVISFDWGGATFFVPIRYVVIRLEP